MRTNAQRPKAPQQTASTKAPAPDRSHSGKHSDPDSTLQSTATEVTRLSHDLAGIPVSPGSNRPISTAGSASSALRGNAAARQPGLKSASLHHVGSARTIENSNRRLVQRIPIAQLITRAPADELGFDVEQAGEENTEPEEQSISGLEDELSSLDSISSTITLVPTVTPGGAAPGATEFGVTGSRASLSSIVITPGTGSFALTANLDLMITWQVRSGTGPSGQIDIASVNDGDITDSNYPTVASDLTPDMSSDNGRPPRTMFWAEDLTERHELFHTRQRSGPFGAARVSAIKTFLDGRTASSAAEVRALLPAALTEGQRVFNALIAAPAGEGDAYADGAPLYQARADAITAKGDRGGYLVGDFPLPDPNAPRFA